MNCLLGTTFYGWYDAARNIGTTPVIRRRYLRNSQYKSQASCAAAGLRPLDGTLSAGVEGTRRVIDFFTFNHEVDLLEVRLHEMSPEVDFFVVAEADMTQTGQPKEMLLKNLLDANDERFEPFRDKIVHVAVTDLPDDEGIMQHMGSTRVGPLEQQKGLARDHLLRTRGFQRGLAEAGARNGDIVISAACDEIVRASALGLLKHCTGYEEELVVLSSRLFFFSFEFEHNTHWHYPNAWVLSDERKNAGGYNLLDRTDKGLVLADAGWHCTYCFRNPEDRVTKLTSNAHVNANTEDRRALIRDEDALFSAYCRGEDPLTVGLGFGHHVVYSTIGMPDYVVQNPDRFDFLMPNKCPTETPTQLV